jgi:uncharacterized coiled-coil DUF342 family protein
MTKRIKILLRVRALRKELNIARAEMFATYSLSIEVEKLNFKCKCIERAIHRLEYMFWTGSNKFGNIRSIY